jgi:hypothetical protein
MANNHIKYLREKAVLLRQTAAKSPQHVATKLLELADEFELKADEIEAAARSRATC